MAVQIAIGRRRGCSRGFRGRQGIPVQLAEQVVLVTGAGCWLGCAIPRAFAYAGARVVVNDRRSRAAGEALAREPGEARAVALQAGVTDALAVTPESVLELIAASKPLRQVTAPVQLPTLCCFLRCQGRVW